MPDDQGTVSPEGSTDAAAAGTDGFPDSGYGPSQARASGSANAIAALAFVASLGMLGTGFALRRRAVRVRK